MARLIIALGSDHGGFEQKRLLGSWLSEQGLDVVDFGCDSEESCDYPDYAKPVCEAVAAGEADFGVLVCGTGIGMQIAANKCRGIRAANVTSEPFAKLAREHNDANVVTLSGRFVSLEENKAILKTFLTTDFAGGRHARRVGKIMALENER
ncbi:MAG: ribose 5-phosphate isomerase B [Coriobacteriales bacterium]|jgi:ribose 5-phosphate isomerase B